MVFTNECLYKCIFCSDLSEMLNIMKSIFDQRKESARKTVKAKINETLLTIVLKKHQSNVLNKFLNTVVVAFKILLDICKKLMSI